MKRIMPYILLTLSALCLLASVWWAAACVADHRAITADPSASGIDFLGLGFLYGLGFVFCGVPGLTLSALCRRCSKATALTCVSYVLSVIFLLCLLAALVLWLFGPGGALVHYIRRLCL